MQQHALQLQNCCVSARRGEPFPFYIVSLVLIVPEFRPELNVHTPDTPRRGVVPCSSVLHLGAAFAMKTGGRAANWFGNRFRPN